MIRRMYYSGCELFIVRSVYLLCILTGLILDEVICTIECRKRTSFIGSLIVCIMEFVISGVEKYSITWYFDFEISLRVHRLLEESQTIVNTRHIDSYCCLVKHAQTIANLISNPSILSRLSLMTESVHETCSQTDCLISTPGVRGPSGG